MPVVAPVLFKNWSGAELGQRGIMLGGRSPTSVQIIHALMNAGATMFEVLQDGESCKRFYWRVHKARNLIGQSSFYLIAHPITELDGNLVIHDADIKWYVRPHDPAVGNAYHAYNQHREGNAPIPLDLA